MVANLAKKGYNDSENLGKYCSEMNGDVGGPSIHWEMTKKEKTLNKMPF